MTWTQPLCRACWDKERPHDRPYPMAERFRVQETCCLCGQSTDAGIYVRRDPKAVPFPTLDDVGESDG